MLLGLTFPGPLPFNRWFCTRVKTNALGNRCRRASTASRFEDKKATTRVCAAWRGIPPHPEEWRMSRERDRIELELPGKGFVANAIVQLRLDVSPPSVHVHCYALCSTLLSPKLRDNRRLSLALYIHKGDELRVSLNKKNLNTVTHTNERRIFFRKVLQNFSQARWIPPLLRSVL